MSGPKQQRIRSVPAICINCHETGEVASAVPFDGNLRKVLCQKCQPKYAPLTAIAVRSPKSHATTPNT